MKIIISPAKTQKFLPTNNQEVTVACYQKDADNLRNIVAQMDIAELMQLYKIKEPLAKKLHTDYRADILAQQALGTYTGIVFQYMAQDTWTPEMWAYAQQHVTILDAMYGVLRAQDGILPYRLDMGHSAILEEGTLVKYWEPKVQAFFAEDDFILNLASKEFSSLLPAEKLLTVSFLDEQDGQFKAINTYVKMARGAYLAAVVRAGITSRSALEAISILEYTYNAVLSDTHNLIYTRLKKEE